jgi:hypothetical protein
MSKPRHSFRFVVAVIEPRSEGPVTTFIGPRGGRVADVTKAGRLERLGLANLVSFCLKASGLQARVVPVEPTEADPVLSTPGLAGLVPDSALLATALGAGPERGEAAATLGAVSTLATDHRPERADDRRRRPMHRSKCW